MAIGPIFQEARQNKQLTTSQVAEMTRMKVQIVDDLEHDDFHRIAATIYGKGFIKLYAECVDINPDPLIEDYLSQVGKAPPPTLPTAEESQTAEDASEDESQPVDTEEESTEEDDLFSYASKPKKTKRAKSNMRIDTASSNELAKPKAPMIDWDKIVNSCVAFYRQTTESLVKKFQELRNKSTQSGISEKWMIRGLIGFGIIVLLLLLIPIARAVFSSFEPAPLPDDELILFVQPPEPYLD